MKYIENKPYIFFSYAHTNGECALDIISRLEKNEFNVWYDEGIEVGTEYSDYIAEHIECCRVFVCVMNEEYINSRYCRDEIDFAINNDKDILVIYTKEQRHLNMPAGLKMRIARYQAVFLNRARSMDQFMEGLYDSVILRPCCLRKKEAPKAFAKKATVEIREERFEPTYEEKKTAARIIDMFSAFGVKVDEFCGIAVGPRVTRYEFKPGKKEKLSKIASLADDISLFLGGYHVRMICPIPGKAAFGIEVVEREKGFVDFNDVYGSEAVSLSEDPLKVALGKDLCSKDVCMPLSKMPHLLVGGRSGSGKTALLCAMILSIVKSCSPDEARVVLIDTKGGAFSPFRGSAHLLCPVVTDPKESLEILRELYEKVESRYKLFSEHLVRNIDAYNGITEKKLHRIVAFIDESSVIMSKYPKEFEETAMLIAQRGRAVGIHLVIATNDLSSKNVTGVLKANIPSRIVLAVKDAVESRTVIDVKGAERLLSKGDMLYCPLGANMPERIQGAYISPEEIEKEISSDNVREEKKKLSKDVYDALSAAVETGVASPALLQEKLGIGYAKALKLIKELEALEALGPSEGKGKPRRTLITKEDFQLFETE